MTYSVTVQNALDTLFTDKVLRFVYYDGNSVKSFEYFEPSDSSCGYSDGLHFIPYNDFMKIPVRVITDNSKDSTCAANAINLYLDATGFEWVDNDDDEDF